ncbi:MAG: oxygen-independent coproporphyrinogen III oxidase [Bacteroidetes bacterium]|nr:oxygen-independent coproporphyrinogen III oxidase [Bacteroidota bacterium]
MEKELHVDIDVLKKYDAPGPRYTSYPPAPLFSNEFTPEDFRKSIIQNNAARNTKDMSLYFHIPFCDTLCYFCGCNMVVTRDRKKINNYIQYLKKEITFTKELLSPGRKVTQLHWGGGTPSYLNPDEIMDLGEFTNQSFTFVNDPETGVEIDPRGLTKEHIECLRRVGFNRISMGIQDFDSRVQEAVNRIQPEDMTITVIGWARELGFKSINVDLIYGLPFQEIKSFEYTLDRVIDISPDRIAVFNFAYVPWLKPHQKIIKTSDLPSLETKLQLLKLSIEKLTSNGYVYIGMDHFAKPTDELSVAQVEKTLYRNFQGYSTRAGSDLYAFGISAISQVQDVYAQNIKEFNQYYQKIDGGVHPVMQGYRMNKDDLVRKEVIMQLMCNMELDKSKIEKIFDISFDNYFEKSLSKLRQFSDDGLVINNSGKIIISRMGRLVLRNIAMCFDAYLDDIIAKKPIFSRTI